MGTDLVGTKGINKGKEEVWRSNGGLDAGGSGFTEATSSESCCLFPLVSRRMGECDDDDEDGSPGPT